MKQYEFKLQSPGPNKVISELFGVPEQRSDEMHAQFTKILEKMTEDQKHGENFSTQDLIQQFTEVAENDQEVHYCIFQAGAKNQEFFHNQRGITNGAKKAIIAAALHALMH
jgi:hypothetical protein